MKRPKYKQKYQLQQAITHVSVGINVILTIGLIVILKGGSIKTSNLVDQIHAQESREASIAETVTGFGQLVREVEVEKIVYDTPKTIEEKIRAKFGKHSDKALLLLTGPGCAENRSLNPKATNQNPGSIDRGVFQINDKWQGFAHQGKANQFLYDPDINIDIAWRLYEDSGYSFKLWTCGRYHGI